MALWIALIAAVALARGASAETIAYWDSPRQGSNLVDTSIDRASLERARDLGIKLVRISPTYWKSRSRDFLFGSLNRYFQLRQSDLDRLFRALTTAHELGLRVVVTTHTLPGVQRPLVGPPVQSLWSRRRSTDKAVDFWRQLATALKGHPALAGYDLIDGPRPESPLGWRAPGDAEAVQWLESKQGTTADLSRLYELTVKSIRSVDAETPILVESGFGAAPEGFALLRPLADSKVIYSFHLMGEKAWSRSEVERAIAPVVKWQGQNHVPSSRILVGAFGVPAGAGAERALGDAVAVFKKQGWHWLHYGLADVVWPERRYAALGGALFNGLWSNP